MPSYEATLSAVDQMMPRMHVPMWLVFEVEDVASALRAAQKGLDRTVAALPFLSGQVFTDVNDGERMKIKWADDKPEVAFQDQTCPELPKHDEFASTDFDIQKLPSEAVSINAAFHDHTVPQPVLLAAYVKLDRAILLLLAPHHAVMDGGGRHIMFELWASNCRELHPVSTKVDPQDPCTRRARLPEIGRFAATVQDSSVSGSTGMSSMSRPTDVKRELPGGSDLADPPGAQRSTLLCFSTRKLESLRREVRKQTKQEFSLNTMLSSVIWVIWITAVMKRIKVQTPDLIETSGHYSKIGMVMDARPSYVKEAWLEKGSWIGNLVSQASPEPRLLFRELSGPEFELQIDVGPGDTHSVDIVRCPSAVVTMIEEITKSLINKTATGFTKDFIAFQALQEAPEWDANVFRQQTLTNGFDFVVSNWAAMDFLQEFGPALGRPRTARVSLVGAPSGICVMLPRRRDFTCDENIRDEFDVLFVSQEQDSKEMENSELLQALRRISNHLN